MKMADLILANKFGEKITKFVKINSLQNYPLYGIFSLSLALMLQLFCAH